MASMIDTRPAEEAAQLAERMASYTISSPEVAEVAADDLRRISGERKRVEEIRKSITRPMDEAKAAAMAAFKPYLERIEAAEAQLRTSLSSWVQAEALRVEREKREAAERERQEAAALEAQALEAAGAGDEAAFLAAQDKLDMLAVAPAQDVQAAQKLSGISTRSSWTVDTIDLRALVQAAAKDDRLLVYLSANESQIGKEARAMGDRLQIPGVTIKKSATLAVRSK